MYSNFVHRPSLQCFFLDHFVDRILTQQTHLRRHLLWSFPRDRSGVVKRTQVVEKCRSICIFESTVNEASLALALPQRYEVTSSFPPIALACHQECTLMFRNLSHKLAQEDVKRILDGVGLAGKFSFVYVPQIVVRRLVGVGAFMHPSPCRVTSGATCAFSRCASHSVHSRAACGAASYRQLPGTLDTCSVPHRSRSLALRHLTLVQHTQGGGFWTACCRTTLGVIGDRRPIGRRCWPSAVMAHSAPRAGSGPGALCLPPAARARAGGGNVALRWHDTMATVS